jgi:hypothetical protein
VGHQGGVSGTRVVSELPRTPAAAYLSTRKAGTSKSSIQDWSTLCVWDFRSYRNELVVSLVDIGKRTKSR